MWYLISYMKKKRKSYLVKMQSDLKIAEENNMIPAIIDEIKGRIEAFKKYKHDYYIRRKNEQS